MPIYSFRLSYSICIKYINISSSIYFAYQYKTFQFNSHTDIFLLLILHTMSTVMASVFSFIKFTCWKRSFNNTNKTVFCNFIVQTWFLWEDRWKLKTRVGTNPYLQKIVKFHCKDLYDDKKKKKKYILIYIWVWNSLMLYEIIYAMIKGKLHNCLKIRKDEDDNDSWDFKKIPT
jgi:hypothetical protein